MYSLNYNMRKETYNNLEYSFVDSHDLSLNGSINEIIKTNEYMLQYFTDCESSFIDIGANHGVATLILAKQNPRSKVYAFEPDPEIFEKLVANVAANNLTNVVAKCMAVSDDSTKVLDLIKHPQFSGGNTTCSEPAVFQYFFRTEKATVIKVPCVSLDDIINQHNITNIKLLKIDCEGAEYDILYNSEKLKTGIVSNLVGEFHNLSYNNKAANNSSVLEAYVKKYVPGIIKVSTLTI